MSNNQYSKKEINDKINQLFADNEDQAITANDLRIITRDYMNGSSSSPMLIYSGKWQAKAELAPLYYSNSSQGPADYYGDKVSYEEKITDTYIDTDFFRQHNPDKPTSTSNLWSIDTVAVPGADDGIEYLYPDGNDFSTSIKLTISSNVITKLEIVQQGGNHEKGKTKEYDVAGNPIVLTYNSVINHDGRSVSSQKFKLTTNSSRRSHEKNHTTSKTIVQVTPLRTDTTTGTYGKLVKTNEVAFWGGTYSISEEVRITSKYRQYKRTSFPGEATVTIWRIPQFN